MPRRSTKRPSTQQRTSTGKRTAPTASPGAPWNRNTRRTTKATGSRSSLKPRFAKRTALGAWQIDGKGRAFSGGALDGDPASVVLGHVPHYGEAQARSAGSLRAGLVHPVETLEDARDLRLRDADAGV